MSENQPSGRDGVNFENGLVAVGSAAQPLARRCGESKAMECSLDTVEEIVGKRSSSSAPIPWARARSDSNSATVLLPGMPSPCDTATVGNS